MSREEVQNDLQYPQPGKWRDMEEVVRCKNCKDWYPFADKLFGYCRREYWDDEGQYRLKVETNHDDYCSYGERRNG